MRASREMRGIQRLIQLNKIKKEAILKFIFILYYYSVFNRLISPEEKRVITSKVLALILSGRFTLPFNIF